MSKNVKNLFLDLKNLTDQNLSRTTKLSKIISDSI